MVKISSGMGDKGYTNISNINMKKSDIRVEAYGCIDELSSLIGYIISNSKNNELNKKLEKIQKELYLIGFDMQSLKQSKISESHIKSIEKEEEILEKKLPVLNNFILPGGTKTASLIHVARAMCRRCERTMVKTSEEYDINKNIIIYLNRLSDFLFLLARNENFENNFKEKGVEK